MSIQCCTLFQLSETVGWFISVLQKLVKDLAPFLIAMGLPLIFISLSNMYFAFLNEDYGQEQYQSFFTAIQYDFLVLIGFAELPPMTVKYAWLYRFIKVYTSLATLISVNFLIAIFTDSVSKIMENNSITGRVQQTVVLWRTEQLFRRWPFFEVLYRKRMRKIFHVDENDENRTILIVKSMK